MFSLQALKQMQGAVRLNSNHEHAHVQMEKHWDGPICRSKLTNLGRETAVLQEAVLFSGPFELDPNTRFYGEGFSMLSQYGGTINQPADIGHYNDHKHYKIPKPDGVDVVYNLFLLSPSPTHHILLAFSSCRRFSGEFRFGQGKIEVVLDLEGIKLEPGQSWELEEFLYAEDSHEEDLLDQLAIRLAANHPPLPVRAIPTGWCSWYYYGPRVTEKDILDNLKAISENAPGLTYIQIDDGYQQAMGDWLKPNESFYDMKSLCLSIKEKGFEPAVWVAPFIAEQDSDLFRNHPDWFIRDENGNPLPSDRVSFGGWRRGPWYMLDGTHPDAQNFLTFVFSTMRKEWSCHYFKLDANMWGALHGGYRYEENKTRIEAYRAGMEAILRGAGDDSFLLGCNAPMWPSIGTVHGMRVTNDIKRDWNRFSSVARECFYRNWQHNRLWVNDPDCVLLENAPIRTLDPNGEITYQMTPLSKDEFMFHATFVYASGGMVLSGDNLTVMKEESFSLLAKLLPPAHMPARFEDRTFRVGWIHLNDQLMINLFNWEDEPSGFRVSLPFTCEIKDFWTGENLGIHSGEIRLVEIPPRSARLLVCDPIGT